MTVTQPRRSLAERRLRLGRLSLYIEPRDAWIGAYVAPNALYVCPLPFLVLRWQRGAPRCPAHGRVACRMCSQNRNPSACTSCVYYAETGMHWDTCPNRVKARAVDRRHPG